MIYIFSGFGLRMLPNGAHVNVEIEEVTKNYFTRALDDDMESDPVEAHAPTKDAAALIESTLGLERDSVIIGPAPEADVDDVVYALIPGPSFRFFIMWIREATE